MDGIDGLKIVKSVVKLRELASKIFINLMKGFIGAGFLFYEPL